MSFFSLNMSRGLELKLCMFGEFFLEYSRENGNFIIFLSMNVYSTTT